MPLQLANLPPPLRAIQKCQSSGQFHVQESRLI
jgi:hypothetical protein